MRIINKEFEEGIYIPKSLEKQFKDKNAVFFDIETTGLNSMRDKIVLIGIGYVRDGKYIVEQFFAENLDEERDILIEFRARLQKFDMVVTFNGQRFDVPFVNSRLEINEAGERLYHENFDLILPIRANKDKLGLNSCSLKNVERHLGIKRMDLIDGGESVNLYYEFLESKREDILQKILLHNFEDVYNLPEILKIFDRVSTGVEEAKITDKQKSFLASLLRKNKYVLKKETDLLTKMEASKLIDFLLNGGECQYASYLEKRGN